MTPETLRRQRQKLKPLWQIVLLSDEGDADITARFSNRLVSLRITDKDGIEADELELVLDDADGKIQIPPTGALLSVRMGWEGLPLVGKGQFSIDELDYSGSPDKLTIRGRGAPVSGTLNHKKARSWHQIKLGEMVDTIAQEHGLTPAISPALAAIELPHIDQTEETDLNLLTRLAQDLGASFSMKEERLIMIPAGQSETVSGKAMPSFDIHHHQCSPSYSWNTTDRTKYTGVEAAWHDPDAAERITVLVGTDTQVKTLRKVYPDQASAQRAAEAELARLIRGEAKLSLTLTIGNPSIGPEAGVTAIGFKPVISTTPWVVKEAAHTITGSGYSTALQMETKIGQ